jgi:hypothetical protein
MFSGEGSSADIGVAWENCSGRYTAVLNGLTWRASYWSDGKSVLTDWREERPNGLRWKASYWSDRKSVLPDWREERSNGLTWKASYGSDKKNVLPDWPKERPNGLKRGVSYWSDEKSVLTDWREERPTVLTGRTSYWRDGKVVLQYRRRMSRCINAISTVNLWLCPFSLLLCLGKRASRQKELLSSLIVREAGAVPGAAWSVRVATLYVQWPWPWSAAELFHCNVGTDTAGYFFVSLRYAWLNTLLLGHSELLWQQMFSSFGNYDSTCRLFVVCHCVRDRSKTALCKLTCGTRK